MLRTRDYALMLSAAVFLLVGITTTILTGGNFRLLAGQSAAVFTATQSPDEYTASVGEKEDISREDRIASLRKKISKLGNLGVAVEEHVDQEVATSSIPEAGSEPVLENRCANYSSQPIAWNSAGVRIDEVEDARLVYRETKVASSTASSSSVSKKILAQLPVRSMPLKNQTCIPSIVIGITINGALIKNTDAVVYGSFGAETLVGYALDGFPIYGAANKKTDVCGGLVEGGQYRYQISSDRDTIITCFAGAPVSL